MRELNKNAWVFEMTVDESISPPANFIYTSSYGRSPSTVTKKLTVFIHYDIINEM